MRSCCESMVSFCGTCTKLLELKIDQDVAWYSYMPCANPCKLLSCLTVCNSLSNFIPVLPTLNSMTLQNFFWNLLMPEDVPWPKESKTAFKKVLPGVQGVLPAHNVSGRTPSAILPFCQQALQFCREHCRRRPHRPGKYFYRKLV